MAAEPDEREWIERIGPGYRSAAIESDSARRRLSERLRAEGEPGRRAFSPAWWIARISFRARPAVLAGAALGMLAAGTWLGATLTGGARTRSAAPSTMAIAALPHATFAVVAPGASRVTLVADFNGWDPQATPLRRTALADLWTADVAVPSGVHVYAFVVDGKEWIPDPSAPLAPAGRFGARTSVVVIPEGSPL